MEPEPQQPEIKAASEDGFTHTAAHPTTQLHAEEGRDQGERRDTGDTEVQDPATCQGDGKRHGGHREG